ncbi:uncharacterized protein K489DRAFT_408411 [Dissoconium aciculare CBS 342.82]|uniref:Uncharacterized protein n=1 Tax=Dissoconium aciculare CBS 342.82 TaxID=1314786 RepID=A0A6J3M7D5_9PEZI|nr:uncharacterized protein K489DRAFT_408411 [Dissoconium aciculare CBS 342.82]KAF1823976.1 hypothetical protein K489DRAFT_408411 [Dissoconium aciculare CBS 342.82]
MQVVVNFSETTPDKACLLLPPAPGKGPTIVSLDSDKLNIPGSWMSQILPASPGSIHSPSSKGNSTASSRVDSVKPSDSVSSTGSKPGRNSRKGSKDGPASKCPGASDQNISPLIMLGSSQMPTSDIPGVICNVGSLGESSLSTEQCILEYTSWDKIDWLTLEFPV